MRCRDGSGEFWYTTLRVALVQQARETPDTRGRFKRAGGLFLSSGVGDLADPDENQRGGNFSDQMQCFRVLRGEKFVDTVGEEGIEGHIGTSHVNQI